MSQKEVIKKYQDGNRFDEAQLKKLPDEGQD